MFERNFHKQFEKMVQIPQMTEIQKNIYKKRFC